MSKLNLAALAAAAALLGTATPAIAQDTATTDPMATTAPVEEDRDDDSGKWGLLGLLGLAGLLGLKRRDRDDDRRTTTGNTTR